MTVYASLSISIDGYYTGPNPSPLHPMGRGGELLHDWFAHDVADRHQLSADDILAAEFDRLGAMVMGRDSYEHAQAIWGEQPPFEVPIFVVTHQAQSDDVRDGTTFHFVTDGFENAVQRAGEAAGDRDVGLHGGGSIQQGLRCGVLRELQLHTVPTLLGDGRRLFQNLDSAAIQFAQDRVAEGNGVTHVRYQVRYARPSGARDLLRGK